MFVEVLETALVNPVSGKNQTVSTMQEVLPYTYSALGLKWTAANSGSPGGVRKTLVPLFSRMKNVLIYGQGTDHGIKLI